MSRVSLVNKIRPIPDRPLHEGGIKPIEAFELGGTSPAFESLELETGSLECACV